MIGTHIRLAGGLFLITGMLAGATRPAWQWERWETAFTAESAADGQSTRLEVHLTSPGGRQQTLDGFWDGDRVWRFRFLPDEAGRWEFHTTSRPEVPGLHGRTGAFECQPARGATRFQRHGRIGVSTDGHHFVHADGTPFFWLADTVWNGALLSTADDWQQFLENRRSKQFTAIQFVATQWRTAYTDLDGQVAHTGYESIVINPRFFQRLEQRLAAVNAHDMLAVPVLLWTLGSREHNPGQLPEDQAIRLARYQIARFQGDHVVYFLPGDGNYSGANAERWTRIGRAVFDRPGHAPATLHPQGMQWPFDAFLNERWVSFFGYQSGHGDDANTLRWIHSGPPAEKWKLEPARPVINLEPPYEDHIAYQSRQRHTDDTVRRAVYWSLLNAPTAGVTYGAHGVWSWETEPREPQEHRGTGIAQPWSVAMDLPGSRQMQVMAELFNAVDWWRLRPDSQWIRQPENRIVRTEPTHVLYTRNAAGLARLHLDGQLVASRTVPGDFSNWNDQFHLALANELSGDRPWLGEIRGVALYDRVLSPDQALERARMPGIRPAPNPVALYPFDEGGGDLIRDRAGSGSPLDLTIRQPGSVRWLPGGGIAITAPTVIASQAPARRLVETFQASGELTLEAWIQPGNLTQAGPARIVTLSRDTGERNLTLGQNGPAYQVRLRTSKTSPNGEPALDSPGGIDPARFIAGARSAEGDLAVIYFPTPDEAVVPLDRLNAGIEAHWVNPRSGEWLPARPLDGDRFQPPDAHDSVLLLATPGTVRGQASGALLSHNVFFKLKDASPTARQRLIDACHQHLAHHPGTVWFGAGALADEFQREVNDRGFDVALHIVFANRSAHDRYQADPRHHRFIEEQRSNWESVRVFDSWVTSVPPATATPPAAQPTVPHRQETTVP